MTRLRRRMLILISSHVTVSLRKLKSEFNLESCVSCCQLRKVDERREVVCLMLRCVVVMLSPVLVK